MRRPCIAILPVLALVFSCASAGMSPLAEDYRKFREKRRRLYIQNFENRTYSPQLTGRLKEKLQLAYARNASLAITPEKNQAELVLYGKILLYVEEPGVFDRGSQPLTYNLTLVAAVKLRPRAVSGAEISEEQHEISYMTTYNMGEPMFETRYMAEDRLLEGLADRIAAATYEPKEVKP